MKKLIILLLLVSQFACKSKVNNNVQTTIVKRGLFTEEITEEGTVRAVNSISISAPTISWRYGGLKITSLVNDGKEVMDGDTVITFDPSEIKKGIIEAQQRLEIAKAELDKMKIVQQSEIEDLESEFQITSLSQEISKINFEQSVYEAEVTKKEIKLNLEKSNIALGRAKDQIENKKKIHREDLYQKKLNITQLENELADANRSLTNLTIQSPSRGIAIISENWMTDQKWQVGDQPYSGTPIIELPDLSEMKCEVKINEVDVSKIILGQKVAIKPDVFSDTTFAGEVTAVANLAQNKDNRSKIKVFPVQINIKGASKNLLPGLTVSCKININEVPNVLFIPLEAMFKDHVNSYVYVKTSTGFKRQDVKVGATNTDFIIITEGLKENDEIALSDPFLNSEKSKEKSKEKSGISEEAGKNE